MQANDLSSELQYRWEAWPVAPDAGIGALCMACGPQRWDGASLHDLWPPDTGMGTLCMACGPRHWDWDSLHGLWPLTLGWGLSAWPVVPGTGVGTASNYLCW